MTQLFNKARGQNVKWNRHTVANSASVSFCLVMTRIEYSIPTDKHEPVLFHDKMSFHTERWAGKVNWENTNMVRSHPRFLYVFMNMSVLLIFTTQFSLNEQQSSHCLKVLPGWKAQSSTQQSFKAIIRSIKITPTMTYAITMLLQTEMLVKNPLDWMLVSYVEFRMLLVSISRTPCWQDEHRTRWPLYKWTQWLPFIDRLHWAKKTNSFVGVMFLLFCGKFLQILWQPTSSYLVF